MLVCFNLQTLLTAFQVLLASHARPNSKKKNNNNLTVTKRDSI